MGLGTKLCVVFCFLNGLCGLLIAYLFDIGINSMAITAAERRWDRFQKAQACRHAGFLYFILAVILAIRAWRQDKSEAILQRVLAGQTHQSRMWEYYADMQEMTPQSAPLLGSTKNQARSQNNINSEKILRQTQDDKNIDALHINRSNNQKHSTGDDSKGHNIATVADTFKSSTLANSQQSPVGSSSNLLKPSTDVLKHQQKKRSSQISKSETTKSYGTV